MKAEKNIDWTKYLIRWGRAETSRTSKHVGLFFSYLLFWLFFMKMFGWNHFIHSWAAPENAPIAILVPPQFRYHCEAFHKCFKWSSQSRRSSCGPRCGSTSPDGNTSALHLLHQPLHRNGGTISASRCLADSIMFTNLTRLSDMMLRLLVLLCEMVLRSYRIFRQRLPLWNVTPPPVFCSVVPRWPPRINITFTSNATLRTICADPSMTSLTSIPESHMYHMYHFTNTDIFLMRFVLSSARKQIFFFFYITQKESFGKTPSRLKKKAFLHRVNRKPGFFGTFLSFGLIFRVRLFS